MAGGRGRSSARVYGGNASARALKPPHTASSTGARTGNNATVYYGITAGDGAHNVDERDYWGNP
jgi:hypothetical protein